MEWHCYICKMKIKTWKASEDELIATLRCTKQFGELFLVCKECYEDCITRTEIQKIGFVAVFFAGGAALFDQSRLDRILELTKGKDCVECVAKKVEQAVLERMSKAGESEDELL